MICKGLRPRKVATIAAYFNREYEAVRFFREVNKYVGITNLENPTSVTSVTEAVASQAGRFIKTLKEETYRPIKRVASIDYVNPHIHALEGQVVKLASELRHSSHAKGKYAVNLDFYAVDERAKMRSPYSGQLIFIPVDSVVYQVSEIEKFKAYRKNRKIYFLRTEKDMEVVDIVKVDDRFYIVEEEDMLRLIKLVDNSGTIRESVIKAQDPKKADKKATDEYISFDKKSLVIPKSCFEDGLVAKVEALDGSVEDVKFNNYNLARINPALSGIVRSLKIGDELYITNTKVE